MVDYRKILVASINAQLEAEGVDFQPRGLSREEEIAYLEALLEAGVDSYAEKFVREKVAKIRASA